MHWSYVFLTHRYSVLFCSCYDPGRLHSVLCQYFCPQYVLSHCDIRSCLYSYAAIVLPGTGALDGEWVAWGGIYLTADSRFAPS